MGLGCGKSSLPKDDIEDVDRGQKDTGERTHKEDPQTNVVADVLNRASGGAGGSAARRSGKAASSDDDDFLEQLLGSSGSIAPPAGASTSSRPAKPPAPTVAPSVAAPATIQYSAAAVKAARLGVPMPDTSDEGRYDILDDYVDNLLGIPKADRPSGWQRPSVADTEKALPRPAPQIIYSNGTRGPPVQALPPRQAPNVQEASRAKDGSSAASAPGKASPFLNGVIGGWAGIDAESKDTATNGVSARVADGTGPAPKRKAKA